MCGPDLKRGRARANMNMQEWLPPAHDRHAGTVDWMPETTETLDAALDRLRLDGAIFFRAEYTEGWAIESPPPADLAGMLAPGRSRVTLFHIVVNGSCTIVLDSGETSRAGDGDVVVLPYGTQHVMHGENQTDSVPPIASLIDRPAWDSLPVVRHGGGGERTDIVCGYLVSDDPLFDPDLLALSPMFVVRPAGAAANWVQASIDFAMTGPSATTTPRLAELVLKEILRTHLVNTPAADSGLLAAVCDPVLSPALAAIHGRPERNWTVSDLATEAAASRSTLDQRFRDLLGRSPMRYLTEWRMHVAEGLLVNTEETVAAIANRVGYNAVEAFSRAFTM